MTAPSPDPAAALCGCADAERTYEQLLDYTAEIGAELDRWKNLAEGWHKHHNDALDARDEARADRDKARTELDRTHALIEALLAEITRRESDPARFNVMATCDIRALLDEGKR